MKKGILLASISLLLVTSFCWHLAAVQRRHQPLLSNHSNHDVCHDVNHSNNANNSNFNHINCHHSFSNHHQQGNWWDSLGTPQYGGTLTVNMSIDPLFWDPNQGTVSPSLEFVYMDSLFGADWTANPSSETTN